MTELYISEKQAKVILDLFEIAYGEGLLEKSNELIELMEFVYSHYPYLIKTNGYLLYIFNKVIKGIDILKIKEISIKGNSNEFASRNTGIFDEAGTEICIGDILERLVVDLEF